MDKSSLFKYLSISIYNRKRTKEVVEVHTMIFNIILYGLLIFMIFRTIAISKRSKKTKTLIEALQYAEDPNLFFEKIDQAILAQEDDEYKTKAKTLKLWGMAYHNQIENFESLLEELKIESLFKQDRSGMSIQMNEDTFFYLLLAIPNILQKNGQFELIDKINEKIAPYKENLRFQMVYALGKQCQLFYNNLDDRGEAFYTKLLDGDYAELSYSKNMIGLYKAIASAQLAKIYENVNEEKYNEQLEMVGTFSKMSVGKRWLNCIDLQLKEEEVEEEKPSLDDYRASEPIEAPTSEERKVNLDDYRAAPPIEKEEEKIEE